MDFEASIRQIIATFDLEDEAGGQQMGPIIINGSVENRLGATDLGFGGSVPSFRFSGQSQL